VSDILFSIDTSRFSSILFSESGRNHTPDYYANLNLSSDERLLFQVMANPNLKTAVFNAGSVLMHKDELVAIAHVVVSGTVEIIHPEGNYIVGPGAVIGLSEGLLGIQASCAVKAETAVNTRMIPIDAAVRGISKANTGLKGICRTTIARILHIREFPAALK
jgi:CRP-like cAMP-binding protein